MVGLCLIAVFAIAAVTATSASALPEWGKCEAQAGGKYLDGNCTTKGKGGSFEWHKGATLKNVPFTGHNVGSGGVLTATIRACFYKEQPLVRQRTRAACAAATEKGEAEGEETEPSPAKVECESEKNTGEASGKSSIVNVNVTFEGCKLYGIFPCKNVLGKENIQVNPLKGALGYINKAKKEVGVLLEPVEKHGYFAHFECGGLTVIYVGVGNKKDGAFYEDKPGVENHGGYDQIISPITPVNTMTSEYEQVYTTEAESPFANIPNKFEGKHLSALEAFQKPIANPENSLDWGPAGEEITNVNNTAEPGEIKG